jgi:hypothetical protein
MRRRIQSLDRRQEGGGVDLAPVRPEIGYRLLLLETKVHPPTGMKIIRIP